jgi:hypothetical protein
MAEVSLFEAPQSDASMQDANDAQLVVATQATAISALQVAQLRERRGPELDPSGAHTLKAFDNALATVLQQTACRLEQNPAGAELPTPAVRSQLLTFEKRHMDRLKAIDTGSSGDLVNAYRELIGRVSWLAGEQA